MSKLAGKEHTTDPGGADLAATLYDEVENTCKTLGNISDQAKKLADA